MTITPEAQFRVSRRLRDDFRNGEAYYALQGKELLLPTSPQDRPSPESLKWHNDVAFLP